MTPEDRGDAAGERQHGPWDDCATADAETALVPSEQGGISTEPGDGLPPAGQADGAGSTETTGQGPDPLSAQAYLEADRSARSVTVVYGDKIDANNYYGRMVDNVNTTAVRGGATEDMA